MRKQDIVAMVNLLGFYFIQQKQGQNTLSLNVEKTYLSKQVGHDIVIQYRTLRSLSYPVTVRPRRPTTVPARKIVPLWVDSDKKQTNKVEYFRTKNNIKAIFSFSHWGIMYYLILNNKLSLAVSSKRRMWLGDNQMPSPSLYNPNRLQ